MATKITRERFALITTKKLEGGFPYRLGRFTPFTSGPERAMINS